MTSPRGDGAFPNAAGAINNRVFKKGTGVRCCGGRAGDPELLMRRRGGGGGGGGDHGVPRRYDPGSLLIECHWRDGIPEPGCHGSRTAGDAGLDAVFQGGMFSVLHND